MKWGVIFFTMISICSMHAKLYVVKTAPNLFLKLASAPYSVAVFYNKERNALKNPEFKQSVTDMEAMMRSLNDDPLYKNADVQFLLIDVSRVNLFSVLRKFAIKELPTFIIFIGREQVSKKITGFIERAVLTEAIKLNLEK